MLRIYSTAACGYCKHAKAFMDKQGIAYEEIRVDRDEKAAREMIHMTGQQGVPVITNGKQYVVGFDPHGIQHLAGVPHQH